MKGRETEILADIDWHRLPRFVPGLDQLIRIKFPSVHQPDSLLRWCSIFSPGRRNSCTPILRHFRFCGIFIIEMVQQQEKSCRYQAYDQGETDRPDMSLLYHKHLN